MANKKVAPGDEEQISLWRVLQEKLMLPLPAEEISWRPGQVMRTQNGAIAKYFPYVSAPTYRKRLDEVLGYANWTTDYSDTANGLTLCKLSLQLDSEAVVREGVGDHKSRQGSNSENTELDEEHGSRTKAFRDACKAFGLCGGHDMDGLVSPWVGVDADEKNGKLYVRALLEPLSLDACVRTGTPPKMSGTGSSGTKPTSNGGGKLDAKEDWEKVTLKFGTYANKSLGELDLDALQDLWDQEWVQKSAFYRTAVESALNVRESALAAGA